MKKKLSILALVLAVAGLTAGCGFYGVKGQSTAGFIGKSAISKIKPGVSENYILARFGMPTEKYDTYVAGDPVKWTYCGNHKVSRTYAGVFSTGNRINKCVTFTFKHGKISKVTVKKY